MPLTKVTPNNLHTTVQTMVTTMVNENAVDSADVNTLFDTRLATKTTSNIAEGSNLYYTDARADARVSLIVDAAPSTLNTLNELAAALGDDANFSTTVTNSIATKLPLAGGTMTGNINLGDNNKAIFGAGSDLQIYHSGTTSFIRDTGDGDLQIFASDDVFIRGQSTNNYMARFAETGAVTLYHNNASKLATTSTGINVTGTITTDGLTVDTGIIQSYDEDLTLSRISSSTARIVISSSRTASNQPLTILGGSSDWNGTTQGTSRGSLHFDPEDSTNNYGSAITFGASDTGGGDNAHAGIYTRTDGQYGSRMYLSTTDSYSSGSKTAVYIDHLGNVTVPRGGFYVSSGNVGIGTTTPSYLIHAQNSTATGPSYIATSGNGQFIMAMGSQNSPGVAQEAFIGTLNDTRFKIKVNNIVRGSWTSSGLAIGNHSSADAPLHIIDNTSSAYGGIRVVGAGTGSGSTNVRQIADFGRTSSGSDSGVWLGGRTDETTAVIGAKTASGNIAFEVYSGGWQERMRIQNNGNVGINEPSPNARFVVQGDNTTMGTARFQPDSNKGSSVSHVHYGTTGDWYIRSANPAGSVVLQDASSATGFVKIGQTSVNYPGNGNSSTGVTLTNTGRITASYNGDHVFNRNSDGILMSWRRSGGEYGSVSISNTSGTTYNTTSDRRLKTDIQLIEGATATLMAMAPVTHKWKAHPSAPAVYGFIAQEMQVLVPEAVSGDPDSDEMMGMDYGRITPVIVAALQDALNEIKELKTRINVLENK